MQKKFVGGFEMGGNDCYRFVKRAADVLFSFVLLALLYIPMLVISIAIRVSTGESSIFRQKRIGRNGRVFVCYKFRTMRKDAPSNLSTAEFKNAEKYITPIGKLLRRSSLDELPQLFNVLTGDMSIVGPRPLIADESEVHLMRKGSGAYYARPGITGLAQVMGRDELDDVLKVYYDTQYVYNMRFSEDVRILLLTFFKVFTKDGVADSGKRKVLDK